MRDTLTRKPGMLGFALLLAGAASLAGCGGHAANKQAATTPTKFAITATEATGRALLPRCVIVFIHGGDRRPDHRGPGGPQR